MNKDRLITLSLMILAAAASRLLPHAPNFTPVAAIALFAGAQFERKWLAFAVPLSALLLSDAALGLLLPRDYPLVEMLATYGGFAAVVGIGFALRRRQRPLPLAFGTLAGAVTFFLITNCALWLPGLYPPTFSGLVQGYVAGIPFFGNTLTSDALYSLLLFGSFALAERRFSGLRLHAAAA